MLALKIAILWHQHQPYYKINNEYKLPWVRLHGIKDYLDLPLLLNNFPNIKQTFNVVPSMLLQLDDYSKNDVNEKILNLTRIPAEDLADSDKHEILNSFFICNFENMIKPYERYRELFDKTRKSSIAELSIEDWRDIQVWCNLTWLGPVSRDRVVVKALFEKGRNFSEDDKQKLLDVQKGIITDIVPTMKQLMEREQIEVSVSPFYHPILPLLCNSDSALEAMPDKNLPSPPFEFPIDASSQLSDAVSYFRKQFGTAPAGLWPSEGSVSNEVLNLVAELGIEWLATDEQIMLESFGHSIDRLERFFPRKYLSPSGELSIFFRDRLLSDLIGFSYSAMEPKVAAKDFIDRLKYVRWEISQKFGEDSLKYAVVPIILDGENCWEFYKDNGKPFLTELYTLLSEADELKTVTYSEANDLESRNYLPPMKNIRAGSWIDANFDIWIGQKEHVTAWDALKDARNAVEKAKGTLPLQQINKAMEHIYIAEGSDWFWWYCDRHQAPNKNDFDVMFRDLLKNVYREIDSIYPKELDLPYVKIEKDNIITNPKTKKTPNNISLDENDWNDAGAFNAGLAMDAMHSSAMSLSKVYILNDEINIFLRLNFEQELTGELEIEIQIKEPFEETITIHESHIYTNSIRDVIVNLARNSAKEISFTVKVKSRGGTFNYPRSGNICFQLID